MDDKKKKKKTLRVKRKTTKRDTGKEQAQTSTSPRSEKKESVDLNQKTSQKKIHQVLPLIFALLAFLIFVTLFLNLLCTLQPDWKDNPDDHWMGRFGYGFSNFLLGAFGQVAFLLPLLLINAALLWRRWAKQGTLVWKVILSVLLFLFSDTFLHLIYMSAKGYLAKSPPTTFDAAKLSDQGITSFAGGVVGGGLGQFFANFKYGSLIIVIACLIVIVFLLWDLSLHRFIEHMKLKKELRSEKVPSLSEQEAEAAGYKAKLDQKLNKLAAKNQNSDSESDNTESSEEEPSFADQKNSAKKKEDDLAPMPIPRLKIRPEDKLFMIEDEDDEEDVILPPQEEETTKEIALDIDEPKDANAGSAVDPIFPRPADGKSAKKSSSKSQTDPFDLFTCFPKDDDSVREDHTPLPPEVPLMAGNVDTTPIRPSSGQEASVANTAPAEATGNLEVPIFRRVDMGMLKLQSSDEGDTTQAPPPEEKPYVFPPISYLHVSEAMTEDSEEEIHRTMLELAETFQNFRVGVKEINYSCGPTVTRYEVTPAPGVRVRAITGLSDDIALSLATSGVRMESNIPGKNAVGVEVPNKHRSTVFLRALIESDKFTESKSRLTACLGVDIAGHPVVFDIASMPHLLIAGTTGSGKSVCINSIILSLLYKARPDEVKLVLIDPKKVEFSIYRNIPHLLAPIVTTPKDAAGALQAAVEEMERRFELFSEVEVPDIKRYNTATKDDPEKPFLPQIVIIIDELADLMMTAPAEVEDAICRIAQKARAAGIHLIVGTQRPSVDVVTGLIKSNIPSRIAFTVSSQVDSRTILDTAGAEKLTGKGDMLFSPIGSTHAARVQGTFVSDDEIRRICDFIRASNGLANYDENFINKLKELAARCGVKKGQTSPDASTESEFGDSDAKYTDAVRIAVEEKKISTSLLQRKLQIGYSRAAKLIDRMESEGIVSPPDGSKPRTILITPEEYMDRFVNVLSHEDPGASPDEF